VKGEILADHMSVNKYTLQIVGLIPITAVEMSGIEDELETTELPDRTVASGGNRKATEFTMMVPAHHAAEQAALELWYRESQDPVSPTYKKPCTLTLESISGNATRGYTLSGVFPKGRNTPDLEKKNEGEIALIEWVMSVDDIIPI
jgi:hypothetical protein